MLSNSWLQSHSPAILPHGTLPFSLWPQSSCPHWACLEMHCSFHSWHLAAFSPYRMSSDSQVRLPGLLRAHPLSSHSLQWCFGYCPCHPMSTFSSTFLISHLIKFFEVMFTMSWYAQVLVLWPRTHSVLSKYPSLSMKEEKKYMSLSMNEWREEWINEIQLGSLLQHWTVFVTHLKCLSLTNPRPWRFTTNAIYTMKSLPGHSASNDLSFFQFLWLFSRISHTILPRLSDVCEHILYTPLINWCTLDDRVCVFPLSWGLFSDNHRADNKETEVG